MALEQRDNGPVGVRAGAEDEAARRGNRPARPSPAALGFALAFYLLVLLATRLDVLVRPWPQVLLPIARIELFFPTTNGHLVALFILGSIGALHWRARHQAIRAFPEIARSDRGISGAGPLSPDHLSLGWSLAWPLQLFSLTTGYVMLLAGRSATANVLGCALLVGPVALAVALLRQRLHRRYGIRAAGLAWPFLWRSGLVLFVTVMLRFGIVAVIGASLHANELPLYVWGAVWAVQTLLESLGFGWAAHQAVITRDRIVPGGHGG